MEPQVVTYQLDDSTLVRFEIEPPSGFQPASGATIAGRVQEAITPALKTAQLLLDRIKDLTPDEVEVKFGLKVSGKFDWLVAKAASEGNFEIRLTWKPDSHSDSADNAQSGTSKSI
jgi:Trypsin-co-occurring domain 1